MTPPPTYISILSSCCRWFSDSLSLGCHLNIMERIWIISTSQVLLANFILLAFFFFSSWVTEGKPEKTFLLGKFPKSLFLTWCRRKFMAWLGEQSRVVEIKTGCSRQLLLSTSSHQIYFLSPPKHPSFLWGVERCWAKLPIYFKGKPILAIVKLT